MTLEASSIFHKLKNPGQSTISIYIQRRISTYLRTYIPPTPIHTHTHPYLHTSIHTTPPLLRHLTTPSTLHHSSTTSLPLHLLHSNLSQEIRSIDGNWFYCGDTYSSFTLHYTRKCTFFLIYLPPFVLQSHTHTPT